MLRRTLLKNMLGGTLVLLLGETLAQTASTNSSAVNNIKPHKHKVKQNTIRIHASKFVYTPNHITLTEGDSIVLELTSSDAVHGFFIPDWNLRSDIPPGQVTLLSIPPAQVGEYVFLCDNFCGDGHEKMQGKITVVARS